MPYNSVYDVIDYINDHAKTAVERGTWWERAVVFFLRHDPEMRQVMGEVRLWADAPTNDGHDTGIDVVCEYNGATPDEKKRYWAVQCKNYDPSHKMDYKELSTFWAKAEADNRYAGYVVVSASDFSKNAYAHAEQTGTLLITPEKMDESNVDWGGFLVEGARTNRETFGLRPHQQDAVDGINRALEDHDRCKAILACGTGKTLMSLRLSEGRCPGGTVLFCAPSIALVSQAMREWTNQARVDLRSLVVCSDAKASRVGDYDDIIDALADLAFPASTDVSNLLDHYRYVREKAPDSMVVIFCTYQSMQVVADAQAAGLPGFDLVVCDEAHRTTGVKATDDEDTTSFLIVHDDERIHAAKRVYMTATPRIYGDKARRTAREQDYVLTSMDDEATYGPTAYEITFSEAVERELLCDYRVVVLAVREEAMPADLQLGLSDGSEMRMEEAAKIVGCYKGLATHGVVSQRRIESEMEKDIPDFFLIDEIEDLEAVPESDLDIEPLHRAVGFCRSIQDSKNIDEMFPKVVEQYNANAHDDERYELECELDHVGGSMNSKVRQQKLSWLASGDDPDTCRVLTNARCLAEGVDVPSLDAVIFFSPRKSEVDVVQAVGRVMRTFTDARTGERKRLGYIVLPVFIPAGMTPEESLNNSQTFDVVWKVLQALRSHDERIEAYAGEYKEFQGALLTDTFQMTEADNRIDDDFFQDNSIRMLEQQDLDITVVVGNPPYSMGQQSANDNNANETYPTLDARIASTYSAKTNATRQSALYDSYIRSFRWASDRIVRKGDNGVVCFVSNAGWLRSAAGEGVRRAFVDEFNSIYVFDLRGNARTQGEERRKERDNVFGMGTRTPIAITMLVKNPASEERGCVRYVDVGDYKTQQEKLDIVENASKQEPEWVVIQPDLHGDWLNQRDDSFYSFIPLGMLDGKKKTSRGMFSGWSLGIVTARDFWVWGYSQEKIKNNIKYLIDNTNEATRSIQGDIGLLDFDSHKFSWSRSMQGYAKRGKEIEFYEERIVRGAYRPFCRQWVYFDTPIVEVSYQIPSLYPLVAPNQCAQNIVIDYGERGPFVADELPDYELDHHGQCFPFYIYEPVDDTRLFDTEGVKVVKDAWGNRYARRDAITDTALAVFQRAYPTAYMTRAKKYGGAGVNKEDIFYYVYGVLHSPEYRERFASNLAKELPRIPLVVDFEGFAEAGRKLADLHLHYEDLTPWPTVETGLLEGVDPGKVVKMRWAKKKDPETGKRVNDYTTLIFNASTTITGIPETAQNYVVNGRSPLDWMIDRYQVKTDKKSGITNDPNEYSDDPCYIIGLVGKLVRVAVEANQIVSLLPPVKEIGHPDNWPTAWATK